MNITFRVDASVNIGTGHVMRCLTLADELSRRGCKCTFICRDHIGNLSGLIIRRGFSVSVLDRLESDGLDLRDSDFLSNHRNWLGTSWRRDAEQTINLIKEEQIDLLIVDHYSIDIQWESMLRPFCREIMVIDDLADRAHDCDFLLDQNHLDRYAERYMGLVPKECILLLGSKYTLLHPKFQDFRNRAPVREGAIKRILIYFGGADNSNLTGLAISALLDLEWRGLFVDVVVDPSNPHLKEVLNQVKFTENFVVHTELPHLAQIMAIADLFIGAAGSSSWERCCVGLPSLVISLAENQVPIADKLHSDGYVKWLGHKEDVNLLQLINALKILKNDGLNAEWSKSCFSLVDGMGVCRVADAIVGNSSSDIVVRLAQRDDEINYLNFLKVEFSGVRESKELENFSLSANFEYFKRSYRSFESAKIFIIETEHKIFLGAVFFTLEDDTWGISSIFGKLAEKLKIIDKSIQVALKRMCNEFKFFTQFKFGIRKDFPATSKVNLCEDAGRASNVLKITICSDLTSWLRSHLHKLVYVWINQGHTVCVVHFPNDAPGGDLCFLLGCGQFVESRIRSKYANSLVIHESDLPKGRGWSPMSWQILEGSNEIPISLLEVVDEFDAGDIYIQRWITLTGYELAEEWRAKQAGISISLCREFVDNYPQILFGGRSQMGVPTTYRRRVADDSKIDVDKTIKQQFNLLRIVDNNDYPAYFEIDGRKFSMIIKKID